MEAINSKEASNLKADGLLFRKCIKFKKKTLIQYLITNMGYRPITRGTDPSERELVCHTDVYSILAPRTPY